LADAPRRRGPLGVPIRLRRTSKALPNLVGGAFDVVGPPRVARTGRR
jgi:hypothetical protein